MQAKARQVHQITTSMVRIVSSDFIGQLDSGELLSGTPSVTAPVAAGLTLTQKQVNSTAITVNGVSCAAGQAVQFKADATSANAGTYVLDITCGTDAGQTLHGQVTVVVVDA